MKKFTPPVNGQRKPAKLALNNGNRYINRFCRGGRPGRPPNQQLTMCFAGRRACAPYSLCCFKINLQKLISIGC
mgnify:FL=1